MLFLYMIVIPSFLLITYLKNTLPDYVLAIFCSVLSMCFTICAILCTSSLSTYYLFIIATGSVYVIQMLSNKYLNKLG